MYFYIHHIETENKTTISLFGTEMFDADTLSPKYGSLRTITVKNIVSPYLFINEQETIENIKAFLIRKKIEHEIETTEMQNLHYKNFDTRLQMVRVKTKTKVTYQGLEKKPRLMIEEFSNPIEQFVIVNKIKGPCVIQINDYEVTGNDEMFINDYTTVKFIKNGALPNLKVAVMSIEMKRDEISTFCIKIKFTDEHNKTNDNTHKEMFIGTMDYELLKNKSELEDNDIQIYKKNDDVIAGINEILQNNNISILIYHNIHKNVLALLNLKGIMSCDIFLSSQDLTKGKDYTITELVETLNITKQTGKVKYPRVNKICVEAEYIYDIFKAIDILELSKQMTEICGNLLSRTLNNQRAERTEYLLLHESYEKNYLFPEKYTAKKEFNYKGGLVLNPAVGFYETLVLLLDFNSLYPSIIQEFNVCFSTVGLNNSNDDNKTCDEKELEEKFKDFETIYKTEKLGFLPKILANLVQRRKQVKNLLQKTKDTKERRNYDIRQKALKLTANSIYGCLGAAHHRFSNFTMASYITYKGREILRETKNIAEDILKMKVIYGDTDSIMIDTTLTGINENYTAALKQSVELKNKINSKYTYIEIEVEKIIKKLLLYTKKKYGCLYIDRNMQPKLESIGLDFTRRDFALVANDLSHDIFKILLTDFEDKTQNLPLSKPVEEEKNAGRKGFIKNNGNSLLIRLIKEKISDYKSKLETLPIEKFILNTQLKRDPEQYTQSVNLPHVSLALRLKKAGIVYKKDDIISYVIGQGLRSDPVSNRTYLVSENYVIDHVYYIENQILPSLHRLLSLFNGISAEDVNKLFGVVKIFKDVLRKKITISTPCCQKIQEPETRCLSCQQEIPEAFYITKAYEMLRQEVAKLYSSEKVCNECGFTTESFIINCVNCKTKLFESTKNAEFDDFLYNLESSFEKFPNISAIILGISNNSDYRTIQLHKYFGTEVKNFLHM